MPEISLERQLLDALIARRSENPPGDEREVATFACELLGGWKLDVQQRADDPSRPNVLATADAGDGGPVVILQSHLDTKPCGDRDAWRTDPYEAAEVEGKVYGLGAADTKGGAAAQLAAIRALLDAGGPRRGRLVWQGVADEEDGSRHGAALLLDSGLLVADGAVVAEPTGARWSAAQLGNVWCHVSLRGRAAHAGSPARGANAVDAACDYAHAVRAALDHIPVDPSFPDHPCLNVGRVVGGGHPGTVPGDCELWLDVRVRPGEQQSDYMDLMQREARSIERRTGVHIQVEPYAGGGCEAHALAAAHPWLADAVSAEREVIGGDPKLMAFSGGTDARFFARAGTPAIVYGPGHLEQAHAPNEYVPVEELRRATRVLEALLRRCLGPAEIGASENDASPS